MNLLIVHSLKPFIQSGHFICIIHQVKPSIYPFIPLFIFPLFIYSIHPSSIPSTLSFYQPINQPIFFYTSHPCIHPYSPYNSPFIYTSIPNTHQSHLAIHPIHSSILPSPTIYLSYSSIQPSIHHSSIPSQTLINCISSSHLIAWTWLCLWILGNQVKWHHKKKKKVLKFLLLSLRPTKLFSPKTYLRTLNSKALSKLHIPPLFLMPRLTY